MKNQIIAGLLFLLLAMICPFPTVLALPGAVWRIILGLVGCGLLASGLYKTARKR